MNRLKLLTLSLFATAVVGSGFVVTEEAQASELALELRINTHYVTDPSFDALSDENHTVGAQLAIGYDLSALGLPGLRSYLVYEGTGQNTSRFNRSLDLQWERTNLMIAADYGPDLFSFLRPSVRLGAGYVTQSLMVSSSGPDHFDRAHDFGAFAALGFEAYIPFSNTFSRVTFGLNGQYGYNWQTEATFDNLRAGDDAYDEEDPWQRQGVDFGTLQTRGQFWNIGFVARIPL